MGFEGENDRGTSSPPPRLENVNDFDVDRLDMVSHLLRRGASEAVDTAFLHTVTGPNI